MRCCKCNSLLSHYYGDGNWYCNECWVEGRELGIAKKNFKRGIYEECGKEDKEER